jgi:hypothetical protein
MNIAIVGSRDFKDLDHVRLFLEEVKIKNPTQEYTIISGGAKGVDSVAEAKAKELGFNTLVFKAEWDKYGKSAGYKRNITIVENADVVYAFWNGRSKGTKHTIDIAERMKKPVYVISDEE